MINIEINGEREGEKDRDRKRERGGKLERALSENQASRYTIGKQENKNKNKVQKKSSHTKHAFIIYTIILV